MNTLLSRKAQSNLVSTWGKVSYAYGFGKDFPGKKAQVFTVELPKNDPEIRKQIREVPKVVEVVLNGTSTELCS